MTWLEHEMKKLTVKLYREPAIHVRRVAVKAERLVYALVVPLRQKYPWGKSRIVYIGTTKRGISRVASSMAARADLVLALYGVKTFEVRVITCGKRQAVPTWRKLESALLFSFRRRYGKLPLLNAQPTGIRKADLFDYFSQRRLDAVLADLE